MEDSKFEEILEKQEKTYILVGKLWRAEKWRRFWAVFRYVIYIGIILGAFYFLTPYIEKATQFIGEFQNIKNPQDLQKIIQQFQK